MKLILMPDRAPVSLVIPCLNQSRYLRAALRSVAAQTAAPLETIVVDDGSTDDTSALAHAAGATVICQPTSGVSAARNRGLRAAAARYVLFLDADDELESHAVETGVAVLERQPDAWMVARCCRLIDADGRLLPTNCMPPTSRNLYAEWLERNLVWTPGAAVFRRDAFAAIGGFPPDVGPAADYAVYLELARANRVVFDPRNAVRYRQHGSNMSRDSVRMLRATLEVLRRERQHVPELLLPAFHRGVQAWCTFYGEQIIQQLRIDARARRFGRAQLDAVMLLFKECRGLALTHMRRKLRRVAGGHPPGNVEPGRHMPVGEGPAAAIEPAEARH